MSVVCVPGGRRGGVRVEGSRVIVCVSRLLLKKGIAAHFPLEAEEISAPSYVTIVL